MADTDVTQTHPYTCNSCAVAFRGSDAQRTHMRSDWHRYNLKRKVADLPPVTSDDFNQKVLTAQATTNAAQQQASFATTCEACQKTYYSQNAYDNHVGSQKHRLRVAGVRGGVAASPVLKKSESKENDVREEVSPEAEAEFERVVARMKQTKIGDDNASAGGRPSAPAPGIEKEEHPLSPEKSIFASSSIAANTGVNATTDAPLSRCLFCNYDSPNPKLSVEHMTKIHGLFIPEKVYLVDLEGLVKYLQAKIHQNYECISCHKLKGTVSGVQTHMRDKGHCKIAFESEEEMIEIGQFYDFRSTYSDGEEDWSDTDMEEESTANGGARINGGAKVNGGGEDEAWETDSDESSCPSEELTSVPFDDRTEAYGRLPLHRHHSNGVERPHRNVDGFHSYAHQHTNAVFYDEHEMHLPSGRVAGHRSLKKYYRQNLHNYPTQAERLARAQRLLDDSPRNRRSDDEDDEDEEMQDVGDPPARTTANSGALLRRGEAGMLGATDYQKREVRKQEMRGRTRAQKAENRYQAKVEKQANSQKHFRDPLLQ